MPRSLTMVTMIGLALAALLVVLVEPVWAGSVTPTANTKVSVYQGVATITPDGINLLEIGNAGRDIAGTSSIYIRPGGLSQSLGAQFAKNGTETDLYVDSLCLYGSGSEVCPNGIPSGGSSDTYWQAVQQSVSYTTLQPVNANTGVQLGSSGSGVNGRALEVYANSSAAAVNVTGEYATGLTTDGYIYTGSGRVKLFGTLNVTDATNASQYLRVGVDKDQNNFALPWNSSNDGATSGLDADTLAGNTAGLHFTSATFQDFFWKTFTAGLQPARCVGGSKNNQACTTNADCPGVVNGCIADPNAYRALCLHTDNNLLCSGGAKAGQVCTTPGSGAECPGGTCSQMCQTTNAVCPADPATGHCAGSATACTDANALTTCGANTTCLRGRTQVQSGYPTLASCLLAAPCSGPGGICAGPGAVTICDGNSGAPAACTIGTLVKTNDGREISIFGTTCTGSVSSFQLSCDCLLTAPTPYLKVQPLGTGGDLCTDNFAD